MVTRHLDETRAEAEKQLIAWLRAPEHEHIKAVLVDDLFGQLRIALWSQPSRIDSDTADLRNLLSATLGASWSGDVWCFREDDEEQGIFLSHIWDEADEHAECPRLRVLERHRNRGAWFSLKREPVWNLDLDTEAKGVPLVAFYSFKGGVGRTTTLASFALARSNAGERIVVLDLDLEAPGVGVLLSSDKNGTTAPWGLVDFFLENNDSKLQLADYYHACRRPEFSGAGEILVFPAGKLDTHYLGKLARVDFEPTQGGAVEALVRLLHLVREQLKPNWILLDARTGLSEPAGVLLSGLAHLHVLFGTSSEQTWQGLRLPLTRLGATRVKQGRPQADCLLVHALVPGEASAAKASTQRFSDRAVTEFSRWYYASEPDDPGEEEFWDLRDLDSHDAPHVPISLSYETKLAHFDDISEVATLLTEGHEYRILHDRIASRFSGEAT